MPNLLDIKGLLTYFNISRSAFRTIQARADFPSPILLNKKKVWREADIAAWVNAQ